MSDHPSRRETNRRFESAATTAERIRAGERSSVEVTEACLSRIERTDGELGAYVTVTADRALETARERDAALERGDVLGPLHGVPVAVKDLEPVAGVRHTAGAAPFGDRIADETGSVARALLDAGAVLVGKTNTPEFGYKGVTDNALVGPTSTPFDLAYNAGGSSGGSAAAVAAGLAPLATGSDGAGSIRIPAALTGTFGMLPSFRRVPRPDGANAFDSGSPFIQSGVLTRTVRDSALALSVLADHDPADPYSLPDDQQWLDALDRDVEGLDVAYSPDLGVYPVADRVERVVSESVRTFADAGATVETVDVELGVTRTELVECIETTWSALFAEEAQLLREDADVDLLGDDSGSVPESLRRFVRRGNDLDGLAHRRADRTRTTVHRAIQDLFDEYDLLVTPTVSVSGVENGRDGPTRVDGTEIHPIFGWLVTAVFNLTGNPAASVPAGLTDQGLPVGMQVVGPRLADEAVIGACATYERHDPWQWMYAELPTFGRDTASRTNT